jgi:hypothetical protein
VLDMPPAVPRHVDDGWEWQLCAMCLDAETVPIELGWQVRRSSKGSTELPGDPKVT